MASTLPHTPNPKANVRSGAATPAFTLQQALERAPTLAHLSRLAAQSRGRLDMVRALLPPALRAGVQAGSIEEDVWCVLVPHTAAAAKLRQLAPSLLQALQARGETVTSIRIKVMRAAD